MYRKNINKTCTGDKGLKLKKDIPGKKGKKKDKIKIMCKKKFQYIVRLH